MSNGREWSPVGWLFVACALLACDQKEPPTSFDPREEGIEAAGDACDAGAAPRSSEASRVVINEVVAGGLIDEQDDWFELHNAGSDAVSLDGWYVEDLYTGDMSKDMPGHWDVPAGTVLCAGAFLLVEREDTCADDPNAFTFGIGSTDRLVLKDASGRVVDDLEWIDLPPTQSFGRIGDDPASIGRLAMSTPRYSNADECECCGECLLGRCTQKDGACVAQTEADCEGSEACAQLGWCALERGRCVVAQPEHCQGALICRAYGKCGLDNGACVVASSDDCRASKLCENEGRCEKDPAAPLCIAASQADCEASDDCVHRDRTTDEIVSKKNRCTLSGARCVATSCDDTTQCEEKMCCDLVDGKCVQGR